MFLSPNGYCAVWDTVQLLPFYTKLCPDLFIEAYPPCKLWIKPPTKLNQVLPSPTWIE